MRSGVKEPELRALATCRCCGERVGRAGPVLYRVRVERIMLDLAACERQQGLAMMLGGNGFLAMLMGANEDLAVIIEDRTIGVCSNCAITTRVIEVLDVAEVPR